MLAAKLAPVVVDAPIIIAPNVSPYGLVMLVIRTLNVLYELTFILLFAYKNVLPALWLCVVSVVVDELPVQPPVELSYAPWLYSTNSYANVTLALCPSAVILTFSLAVSSPSVQDTVHVPEFGTVNV